MFHELTEVKYFKEMKGLKSLQVKEELYLEPKLASMMKIFCENSIAKNSITDARLGSKEASALKIMKFSKRSLGGENHRDCYKA